MGPEVALLNLIITIANSLIKIGLAKTAEARRVLIDEANSKIAEYTARAKELGDLAEDSLDE